MNLNAEETRMPERLFQPFDLGDLKLANRMVMAPMTRNRADASGMVPPMMVTYYQQRADAGLIVTESVPISKDAVGYPNTPRLFNDEHAMSWRLVTDAVHASDGKIYVQLQHCGRISHPSLLPNHATPVSASALRPAGQAVTYSGLQDFVTPQALQTQEMKTIVAQYLHSAELSKAAGFDGIEVHAANGYLIDQFLRDGTNQRVDAYGGELSNRMRLLNEVLDAIADVWPMHRVGVRISPENSFNSMLDSDPQAHFGYFAEQLSMRGLAYLHVLEGDMMSGTRAISYEALRERFSGVYIANNGYDKARAQAAISNGDADLIAFGAAFLANPDLVRRFQEGLPLNTADRSTFYGGTEVGYTDYKHYGFEMA
jgi:N-ethylmaleimide reductase